MLFSKYSVSDLEKICANHGLTDFLKTVSDAELNYFQGIISCDDLLGIRIDILDAILTEKEYRNSDSMLKCR